VLLVGVVLGSIVLLAPLPGAGLARAVLGRLVCAIHQSGCGEAPELADALARAYGAEQAAEVRELAPEIDLESEDVASLPVDFRECRSRSCSDVTRLGLVTSSATGEPATAFVRVVDCRPGRETPSADCSGERAGSRYVQYWLYYPDSATQNLGRFGFHQDDWEGYQVRIGADGIASARATSHHSYNSSHLGLANALSDAGVAPRSGWGPSVGALHVAAGSHAGATGRHDGDDRRIDPRGLRLIPLEPIAPHGGRWEFAVSPPWEKDVWADPESTGTG
jgi:hypothetical protein